MDKAAGAKKTEPRSAIADDMRKGATYLMRVGVATSLLGMFFQSVMDVASYGMVFIGCAFFIGGCVFGVGSEIVRALENLAQRD